MATKAELLKTAVKGGHVPEGATEEEYTVAQLETLISGVRPTWEGSLSAKKPLVAPDGHVALSQADIDARA